MSSPAAERGSSSIGFVNTPAAAATEWTDPSVNPLRSTSAAPAAGNSLRFTSPAKPQTAAAAADTSPKIDENVAPASYNERPKRGLTLRQHAPPTGMLSSLLGETGKKPKEGTPKFKPAPQEPTPPSAAAAKRSQGMVPQWLESATKFPSLTKTGLLPTPKPAPAAVSRAGSVQHSQPTDRAVQAAYETAASAGSYRPTGKSMQPKAMSRGPSFAGGGRPEHSALVRPTAPTNTETASAPAGTGERSTTALSLARAHKLASTAKTEADFSEILTTCQRIRADQATAEEAAFGRQLASWALNRRGQLRAADGRAEEAMADFDTAIRLDAKCWRAIHNRGVLFAQSGQLEQAFDDFQRTSELSPNYAKAYSNRAALFVMANELEQALADYERAAELDPQLAIAHRGCGRTCHMLGRMNEAIEHLDRAAELAPNDATTLASRGDLLTDLGYYADAASDYDRAIKANGKNVEALRSSAWLLATCPDEAVRNPELSLRRAEMAARLERKTGALTFDTLAAAQAAVGDFGSAVSSIRQAIELAPPSERGAYQDRLRMYQQSTPYTISPVSSVQQAQYER